MAWGQLQEWLDELARPGGVVGCLEAIVADGRRILFRHGVGHRVGGEPFQAGSGARFDAGSLTKPWMATLALILDRSSRPGLHDPLPVEAPEAGEGGPVLEDLLRHRAGLPAWTPLAVGLGRHLGDRARLEEHLLRERRPVEKQGAIYSDLDYLLWGVLAEKRCGASLDELLDRQVCGPLGLPALGTIASGDEIPNAVECRLDNRKEVELAAAQGLRLSPQRAIRLGIAQDANARALRHVGVASAHAGLFVTADEMLALGREWLHPAALLSASEVAAALSGDGEYALGWARQSADGSSGPALSASAFGHTGFTGGSLWIDPEAGRIHLLLAHRLSSTHGFNPFRREFHRLASEAASG
jgi:CubicO group peptidase (beta-lactamase class C family)